MDYGRYIKQTEGNSNRHRRNYYKQTPFKGSLREARGAVMSILAERATSMTHTQLCHALPFEHMRIKQAVESLNKDGLVIRQKKQVSLA